MKTRRFDRSWPTVLAFAALALAGMEPSAADVPLKDLTVVAPTEDATTLQSLVEVTATAPEPAGEDAKGLRQLPEVQASSLEPAEQDSGPLRSLELIQPGGAAAPAGGDVAPIETLERLPLSVAPPAAGEARGKVGTMAPAFSLLTPQNVAVSFPAALRQQPTVLMFWPSWCPYTRALQPYVQSIWEDYRAHGAGVWTINIEETRDPLAVMKERQLSFPLLLSGNAVADAFDVRQMPAIVVLDGEGRITYVMRERMASPIEVAKEVREALNALLGERAVALPTEYPKPYDLHLLALKGLDLSMKPIPIPQSEWEPWVDAYLTTLRPGEEVTSLKPRGTIADGKQAISIARELWSQKYGSEQTLIEAPYRSYRINNHWVVLASGDAGPSAKLGAGFIAVLEVDSGRIVRIAPRQ